MRQLFARLLPLLIWICGLSYASMGKDFLTDKEIDEIQLNQEIDLRVKLYLKFAEARLKAAEDRLNGAESTPGDPFEFFSPEEMVDGYYRIFKSLMLNLDDANQNPDPRVRPRLRGALKSLKGDAEKDLVELGILKKIAEEKKNEELWNLVNKAIDISSGALEGAKQAIAKEPEPAAQKPKTR